MSKCGLLFSGANNAWNGIYAQDVEEDCILTAAEVEKWIYPMRNLWFSLLVTQAWEIVNL